MTQRIQKLSPLLINQIAAGEVVTRPASVVKELLENAIDAGATHITIHIEQGGLGLIQISDNGTGIHPDDMTLAVTRHATSKLADVGELSGINSLGFRGEALASIAAVSHLTLTSSHNDTGIGQQLTLSGDEVGHAQIKPIVKNRGTTVSVRDLYYNVPARRGNLKSLTTEFAQIEQVVQRLAISFADISLQLYHQDKLRLNLNSLNKETSLQGLNSPNPNLHRLENALNLPLAHIATAFELPLTALQPLESRENSETAQVTGWLFVTPQALDLPKLIYINQRLVSDLAISQTIAKAARQVGMENVNMGYALFFDLPNDWINVNIHPSKQQVKIQPLANILALLNQALQDILKVKLSKTAFQSEIMPSQMKAKTIFENRKTASLPNLLEDNLCAKNSTFKPTSLQVNERKVDYQFFETLETQSETQAENHFSVERLFDELPKFLKIVENEQGRQGLIFWQDNFYLVQIDLLTQAVLQDKEKFESLLKNSEILTIDIP